ncbi:DNA polymerase II [Candidatus Acidianus copahuensis]|uniref:DNA-directed DNA polymerase n=1 Tax=Candidatus Acidianus copahuensis TaxID=1160895 RepID=A0A031LW43_9CREN|nr:DNA polymerase domain-containing protein [Candidatus Acidianus copahuensis]EZQ11373.1 DNA polymerase II [Candidatus Acidianus copahuensis]
MEGYVVDALPIHGGVTLVLDGFRKLKVKTTFPIYVITRDPEKVMEHPAVLYYEKEKWKDLDGKEVALYRFELSDMEAYYYIKKRLQVVNEIPTVMSQTLSRIGALPFRKVKVEGKVEEMYPEEFPTISYAFITPTNWYGPSPEGKTYFAIVNGKRIQGKLDDLDLRVDVAECYGIACDKVTASVKIKSKSAPVSIKGLIEWSLVSKTLLRELEGATIGKVLTTNEAWIALKRKVIIPKVVPRVEKLRTLNDIIASDKGGLVVFPKLGCYDNVSQLDFSSMYPSIIVKYNISAETVDTCEDLKTEIGHSICLKERGIVPEALEWLVKRKEDLKRVDEERSDAIKWILVASFGYLGYRNSRFGKIEAYELVTYFARKTLREAIELAREHKVDVLHGIVDSMIVKGDRVEDLINDIESKTGLRMKEEKMDWVILFPRKDGMPYPMRYLGKLNGGKMKVKGLVRENMPNVIKDFLEEAVDRMSKARNCKEVEEIRSEVEEIMEKYKTRIINGRKKQDYVMWVKGIPYIRGVRGFYIAERGYLGRDVNYYLDFLRRQFEVLYGVVNGVPNPR